MVTTRAASIPQSSAVLAARQIGQHLLGAPLFGLGTRAAHRSATPQVRPTDEERGGGSAGGGLAHGRLQCDAGRLQFFGDHAHLADKAAFKAHLGPLHRTKWFVYSKRPFAGPHYMGA